MSTISDIDGVVADRLQLNADETPGGPMIKDVGAGKMAIVANDGATAAPLEVADATADDQVPTRLGAEKIENPYPVERQADCSSSLPSNTAARGWVAVTTAGSGAVIGDLLYDDGTSTGTMAIHAKAEGRVIQLTASLTGGTQTFRTDFQYVWRSNEWRLSRADATNIWPEAEAGTEKTIYVRTSGSDTTGDGTSGTPYRTVRRALEDVPYVIFGERYVIDCTGIGQELHTDATEWPPFYSPDARIYDGSPTVPGFNVRAALTVQATPTVLDTITSGQLTSQTQETTTGLRTLVTTKSYTLNQYQDKFVRDANGVIRPIASNTAGPNSQIEIAERSALTAPIEIIECSAELRNSDSGGGNAVEIRNGGAALAFNGIKFSTANTSSFRYGVYLERHQADGAFTMCDVGGYFGNLGSTQPYMSGCVVSKRLALTGTAVNLFSVSIRSATVALRNAGVAGVDQLFWFECIFDSCPAIGGSTGVEDAGRNTLNMDRCIIRDATADAIFIPVGGLAKLQRLRIKDATGDAIHMKGKALLNDVQGTGNGGYGVLMEDGAQARRTGAAAVTGTSGDYKVGGNTVGTWSGFSGNETDVGASSPQLCRLTA